MKISRRELLHAGLGVGLGAAYAAAQTTRPLLGLIAPPANYPVPPEAIALYGNQIRFTVFGLGLKTMTPAGYDSVIDKIVPAAFNQKLIDDVKKATGLPTTSMSTGVIDGLRAVKARRVAVSTAYADEVNGRLRTFLTESGFDVVALKGLGLESIGDPEKVTQAQLQQFSEDVFRTAKSADALLVSCGGLRTLELIAPLEKACGVPVVSSTPHALWAGMRVLGLHVKANGYGRLLANG